MTVSVEGTGDHVCESSDNDAAEQPAEQQEQLAAGLADVLLDQHAHGLAVILDGSVQSAEVGDSTEEDAADQDPQQDGQPAESGSLDGTGDRACTCNGAELVCKHGPAIGGNVVRPSSWTTAGVFALGSMPQLFASQRPYPCTHIPGRQLRSEQYKRIHLYNLPHFLHIFTIACSITLNRCSSFVNGLFIFCQHVAYIANPSKTISKFSSPSTIQKFIDKARRWL